MKKMLISAKMFLLVLVVLFGNTPILASSNVLFILDGSGSMWGQLDGTAKIETAKKVMSSLLSDLPKNVNVGLMAYGHRSEGDCKDVQLLVPIASNSADKLTKQINAIKPKGKTPLAYSLEQSLPIFASLKGQNNYVVLVSDGKETCGGDPCKVAKKLAQAGVNLKVHVVGFDVSGEERKQLECIAKEGRGKYFNAKDTKGFKVALAEVKKEVIKAPPAPKMETYFFDDFDGSELKEHWEVVNPDQDNYMVSDGKLLIIGKKGLLSKGNVSNMMLLTKPLPTGDWVATVKGRVVFQSENTPVFLALFEDKTKYLAGSFFAVWDGWNTWKKPIWAIKWLKGKETRLEGEFPRKWFISEDKADFYLRMKKKGYKYVVSWSTNGKKWKDVGQLTMLKIFGRLAIGTNITSSKVKGETPVEFDWVKVEVMK